MPSALIVGDSHVDWTAFAKALNTKVAALGYEVTNAGIGATSARSWLKDKTCRPKKDKCVKVSHLQKTGPWDLVLISLGTNDAANANKAGVDAGAKTAERVKKLAAKLGGRRTIWILPPVLRGNKKWYTSKAVKTVYTHAPESGLELFNSLPVTQEVITKKSGDGIHPGSSVGKKWAQAVGAQIQQAPSPQGSIWMGLALVAGSWLAWTWWKRQR